MLLRFRRLNFFYAYSSVSCFSSQLKSVGGHVGFTVSRNYKLI
jgi:hypothetical protein